MDYEIKKFKNDVCLMYKDNHHSEVGAYYLCDDYNSDWIIFYGQMPDSKKYSWAHDGYFKITPEMRTFLDNMARDQRFNN
jgi:hypothetical protein